MSMNSLSVTLSLPSDLRYLTVARAFLESVCAAHRLPSCVTDDIVLAAHEAVSNVIRHAHREQPDAIFHIQCYPCCDKMEIHILDEGDPFHLDQVPNLDPSEVRIGGRGVFLMRALMDEIVCEPRESQGNLLRLVKHFVTESSASGLI